MTHYRGATDIFEKKPRHFDDVIDGLNFLNKFIFLKQNIQYLSHYGYVTKTSYDLTYDKNVLKKA